MMNFLNNIWRKAKQWPPAPHRFEIDSQRVFLFRCIVILEYLSNRVRDYRLEDEKDPRIKNIIGELIELGLVRNESACIPTDEGKRTLEAFLARLDDFVKNFEVYRAVDMATGDFAYERYHTNQIGESCWLGYLKNTRWKDLRLLVAEHKKINRDDALLVMFAGDNQLDDTSDTWKETIFGDAFPVAVEQIYNNAITKMDVKSKEVKTEDVLKQVIIKGARLNLKYQPAESSSEDRQKDPAVEAPPYDAGNYQKYLDDIGYLAPCWNRHEPC